MPPSRASAVLAGAVSLFLAACAPGADAARAPGASESAPREVRTALVARASWERSVPALGELLAYERVVVATKVPGRLAELRCERGDGVRQGQVLALLEAREYELRVHAAEAAVGAARALLGLPAEGLEDGLEPEGTAVVREARAELERTRLARERAAALAREGVDSQSAADAAEADLRAAESRLQGAFELVAARRAALAQRRAELEIARAQLAETRVEAPFDGSVVERLAERGAYLATGEGLLELARLDPLRLVLEVAEREAAGVRVGQGVRVRVEGQAHELTGTIARLAPALARAGRALVVEVDVPNPEGALRPGAFVQGRVILDPDEPALTLPVEALVSFAGLDKAFVVRAGKCEERRLVLGRREATRVEVHAGLEVGEEVVLAPGKLGGGTVVRVVR